MIFGKKKNGNDKVIIFNDDGTIEIHSCLEKFMNAIETDTDILRMEDAKKYVDVRSGGITYIFNADIPARMEAQNLKNLRRSSALRNAFSFDKPNNPDFVKIGFAVIAILAIIF